MGSGRDGPLQIIPVDFFIAVEIFGQVIVMFFLRELAFAVDEI